MLEATMAQRRDAYAPQERTVREPGVMSRGDVGPGVSERIIGVPAQAPLQQNDRMMHGVKRLGWLSTISFAP